MERPGMHAAPARLSASRSARYMGNCRATSSEKWHARAGKVPRTFAGRTLLSNLVKEGRRGSWMPGSHIDGVMAREGDRGRAGSRLSSASGCSGSRRGAFLKDYWCMQALFADALCAIVPLRIANQDGLHMWVQRSAFVSDESSSLRYCFLRVYAIMATRWLESSAFNPFMGR